MQSWSGFFDELEKISEAVLRTELLPHQQRVVDRIKKQVGLVVAHPLGSGKTLTSIAAGIEIQPDKIRVLVPSALQENYKKELKKHVEGNSKIEVGSLQKYVADGRVPKADMLIVDEAHRARDPASKTYQVISGSGSKKRMLLTASPMYNRPSDIAPLVNMVANSRVLPQGADFDKKFISKPAKGFWALLPFTRKKPGLKNEQELKTKLDKWVDYEPPSTEGFPRVTHEKVIVPMSERQSKLHDAAWGKLGIISKIRLRSGLPPEKQDLPAINFFQSQTRQISGSTRNFGGEDEKSPKLRHAIKDLKKDIENNPDHKAVVYSNYKSNLKEYSAGLTAAKIPHAEFTGDVGSRDRKKAVEDYNTGKIKALLISSAGGEGLDLKGTRSVQVLDPHWNEEKLHQVIGRAVRYKSHEHLPEDERSVHITRYEAVPIGSKMGIEQVLSEMAEGKDQLIRKMKHLMSK
jgi:SNF2 family DNA or RNA helicase